MQLESKIRRYFIIGFATAAAIFCLTISIYWMARSESANRYDKDANLLDENNDKVHLFDQCVGSASDVSYVELHEICGEDHATCRENFNTRWSTVFEFNAVVLFFLSLSYASVAAGSFIYMARVIGAGCTVFWNVMHLTAIIVTGALRYSK